MGGMGGMMAGPMIGMPTSGQPPMPPRVGEMPISDPRMALMQALMMARMGGPGQGMPGSELMPQMMSGLMR